jgi:hypothetical protein
MRATFGLSVAAVMLFMTPAATRRRREQARRTLQVACDESGFAITER